MNKHDKMLQNAMNNINGTNSIAPDADFDNQCLVSEARRHQQILLTYFFLKDSFNTGTYFTAQAENFNNKLRPIYFKSKV